MDGNYVIDDWVRLVPSPGHTPGHVSIHIGGELPDAVMSGDLMHHPLQCAEPDWNSCFCVDPCNPPPLGGNFWKSMPAPRH